VRSQLSADRDFVDNSPASLKLVPGMRKIAVKIPGYADWSKAITAETESEVQLNASLKKLLA
jgi:hypothetical protein